MRAPATVLMEHGMETRQVTVPAIHCGHCTMTIRNELGELDGVKSVAADTATKQVTVTFAPPASWEAIVALLREIGFAPEG